jgi:hypothetical protein
MGTRPFVTFDCSVSSRHRSLFRFYLLLFQSLSLRFDRPEGITDLPAFGEKLIKRQAEASLPSIGSALLYPYRHLFHLLSRHSFFPEHSRKPRS